jgi:signal transduction histidine kinase
MPDSSTRLKVLIVDDEPTNLMVLEGLLSPLQYDLRQAANGSEALESVAANPPDLILLDVMMPGMSGFEVCRRLKSRPGTQFIPIVLVTALADRDSRVTGIEAGADDFITKPVDAHELRARVRSLLRIKSLHDEVEGKNESLNEANRELLRRYEDLRRLEVMRETLTQMIVHDLRNPLGAVLGFVRLLKRKGLVSQEEAAQHALLAIHACGQTLMDMITAMLDVAKLEAGEMPLSPGKVDLGQVVAEVEMGMRSLLEHKRLEFHLDLPEGLPPLVADRESLRRILVNIVGNAIGFSPNAGRISVSARPEEGFLRVSVRDEGPGISSEDQGRIFEKFGQVESRQSGRKYTTGLGLTYCKMAVEAHGGRIGVESEVGAGSVFWFTLPHGSSS